MAVRKNEICFIDDEGFEGGEGKCLGRGVGREEKF